jgi:hypothetical protein
VTSYIKMAHCLARSMAVILSVPALVLLALATTADEEDDRDAYEQHSEILQ